MRKSQFPLCALGINGNKCFNCNPFGRCKALTTTSDYRKANKCPFYKDRSKAIKDIEKLDAKTKGTIYDEETRKKCCLS